MTRALYPDMPALLALAPEDRPRERLLSRGPSSLSDAELLAILLGSGRQGQNVVEIAHDLLARARDLRGLAESAEAELRALPGVGPARAAVIQAAIEIGRRVTGSRPERGQHLGNAADVWTHYRARLGTSAVEEFWMLALDVRHRVLLEACVARGSLTGVEVHPRDVFRTLIRSGAASVIFCHNHPSGDPAPSRQDLELTTRLRQVGELCGIAVLDHVVVASDGFVSLASRGWC
ncbi:MAG TPA: DNA repair protein RadC [Polyangia bacterium]